MPSVNLIGLVVFWVAILLLAYTYCGYPAIMAGWAAVRPKRYRCEPSEPTIS